MTSLTARQQSNLDLGYAVINPKGVYVRPSSMNAKMRSLVDTGHVKVTEWGKIILTDLWDDDINSIPQPEFKVYQPADAVDAALADIKKDEILALHQQMLKEYPHCADEFFYLVEEKPEGLILLEKKMQILMDDYYTPERKLVDKLNQKAQAAYETAVAKIHSARNDVIKTLEKAEEWIRQAIEAKYAPAAVAERNKIAQMYALAKESSSKREAKRLTVLAIAGMLGKGLSENEIYTQIKNTPEFMALAGKHEERVFDYVYASTVNWIRHKNQYKVFYDLLGLVVEGMHNTKIRKDNKAELPQILATVALHQAKDNDSRAMLATAYLERVTVVIHANFAVDQRLVARRFKAYDQAGYINYAPGVRGGISTRVGLKPYFNELSTEQMKQAAEDVLASFTDAPFYAEFKTVLDYITDNGSPRYNDTTLESAVEALLAVFVPLTRIAADERIAERLIDEVPWESDADAVSARVTEHINSGLGFQPIWMPLQPSESHAKALV